MIGGDKGIFSEETAFVELKMEMQDFVDSELQEESLKEFKSHFQIMFNYLVSSYSNVANTQRNINDTNEKLKRNIRNKADINKNIEEDQDRITNQKQEFENLFLKIDNAKNEEVEKDKVIKQLNEEIIKLNQRRDKDNLTNFKPEELEHKEKLKAEEEDLEAKYELAFYNRQKIQKELGSLIEEKVKSEKISSELEKKKEIVSKEKEDLNAQYIKEVSKKEGIDAHFNKMKDENKDIKEKITKLDEIIKIKGNERKKLSEEVDEIESKNQELSKQIKKYLSTKPKLLKELKDIEKKGEDYEKQTSEYKHEIQEIEKEINDYRKEALEYERVKKKFEAKIKENEEETEKYLNQRDDVKKDIREVEKQIESKKSSLHMFKEDLIKSKKKDNEEKKKLEGLSNELTVLHNDNIFIENTIRRAMNEAVGIKKETQLLENERDFIEAEKNMYAKQSSDAQMEFFQAKERLKNLNEAISDLKAKNSAAEQKLKQQKKIYEAVKADCNRFDKKYQDAKNEIKDITEDKSKKSQKYQFLKIELNYKQKVLADLQTEYSTQETELKRDEETRKNLKKDIEKIVKSIETYQESNNNLNKTISLAENDHLGQKKEYQVVVNERDFIGQQLIQRNDEITSLYEKIKVLQGELLKMNNEYEKKLTEIENLKNSRDFLLEEFVKTENIIKNIFELRVTKIKLEKELLTTKNKLRSLEDQTKRPLNIHRWTKLEYSDPEKYELIMQINSLQRRLIAKTEEVNHKDDLIQEKEKLYIKLKGIVARQSGVDMSESLKNYKKIIYEENEKLKKMSKEVKHLSLTIRNYEMEIKKIDERIEKLKNDFIEKMKKNRNIEDYINDGNANFDDEIGANDDYEVNSANN